MIFVVLFLRQLWYNTKFVDNCQDIFLFFVNFIFLSTNPYVYKYYILRQQSFLISTTYNGITNIMCILYCLHIKTPETTFCNLWRCLNFHPYVFSISFDCFPVPICLMSSSKSSTGCPYWPNPVREQISLFTFLHCLLWQFFSLLEYFEI